MGMLLLVVPVAIALLQAQPARAPERIVLLPNGDGSASAVIVTTRGGETVVDRPWLAASVHGDGRTSASEEDPARVRERYGATLAAMPQGPVSHVLYFEPGSDRLAAESAERLPALRAQLRERAEPEVTLVGHAGRDEMPGYNEALSKARAAAVMRAIAMPGLPEERIGTWARGSYDSRGLPADRRVDLRIR